MSLVEIEYFDWSLKYNFWRYESGKKICQTKGNDFMLERKHFLVLEKKRKALKFQKVTDFYVNSKYSQI